MASRSCLRSCVFQSVRLSSMGRGLFYIYPEVVQNQADYTSMRPNQDQPLLLAAAAPTDRNIIGPTIKLSIRNHLLYNYYMAVTVKVQFRDKLYKLASTVSSLQHVHQEMKQRFPNFHTLFYFYQGAEVTDLAPILAAAANQRQNSIKLVAKASAANESILNEVSMVGESEKNDSSVISLLVEEPAKVQERPKASLPAQFYVCYNCEGKGTLSWMSMMEVCSVCRGAGKLEQSHKYVTRLRQLYFSHFRPEDKAEKMIEEFKELNVSQRKNSFSGVDKNYEIIVRETTKKESVEVGKVFSMRFEIKNVGPSWEGKRIQIVEMGQNRGKTLSGLKSGETLAIEMGPYVCSSEGALEKTYMLCYREGEELVRFGHKFGFSVRGFKPKAVRKMVCSQRQRIRELKVASRSLKSEQYLILKLKSMGIDVMNLELEDEVLVEVIKQFK